MPKKTLIRCLLFACVFAITPTPVFGGFGSAFKAGAAANRYNTTNNMIEGDHRTQEHNGAYSENSSRGNQSSISKDDLVLLGFFGLMAAIGYWIWNRRKSQKSGKHTIQTEPASTPAYPSGQILSYSIETKAGTISASDGKRYEFNAAHYIGDDSLIQRGVKVELIFDEQGNLHEIYPFGTVPAPMSSELDDAQQVSEAEEVYIDSSDLSGPVEKLTGFVKKYKVILSVLAIIPISLTMVWYFYTPHIANSKDEPGYLAGYCLDQSLGKYQYMDDMRKYADQNGVVQFVVRFGKGYSGIRISGLNPKEWYFYDHGNFVKTMYFHPNGRFYYEMPAHMQSGTVRYMDEDGKLEKTITYVNGKGKFEKKYTDGKIALIENYSISEMEFGLMDTFGQESLKNQLDSRFEWYSNGNKKCETHYFYDLSFRFGTPEQQCYFPNGMSAIGWDSYNTQSIDETYYFASKEIKQIASFTNKENNNVYDEKATLYAYHNNASDENHRGTYKYKIEYVLHATSQPERCDEQMKQGLAMIYDLPQGSPRTRTVNGKTCMDDAFVRNGIFQARNEYGTLIKEAHYTDGKLDGDVKEWNSDGELLEHSRFQNGKFIEDEKKNSQ